MTTYQSKDLIGWVTWYSYTLQKIVLHQLHHTSLDLLLHQLQYTFLLLHGATPYISITTRCYTISLLLCGCYTIHLYYYTVLHHISLLLRGCYTVLHNTVDLYCYVGATQDISNTTRCYMYTILYLLLRHNTSLLLHGATPYISIAMWVLHGVTQHISIATWVLHNTSLLLHGATPYMYISSIATYRPLPYIN